MSRVGRQNFFYTQAVGTMSVICSFCFGMCLSLDHGGAFLSMTSILPKACGQDSPGCNGFLLSKAPQTASMLSLIHI